MATLQSPFIPAQPSKPSDPNGIAHSTPKADRAAAKTAWVTWTKTYRDYTYRSTGSDPGKFDHTGFDYSDESTAETFTIQVSGNGVYNLSGNDRNGSVSGVNHPVNLNVGDTVRFITSLIQGNHPFLVKWRNVTGLSSQVGTGSDSGNPTATGQGDNSTITEWTPNNAGTYYYKCRYHGGMGGEIIVS